MNDLFSCVSDEERILGSVPLIHRVLMVPVCFLALVLGSEQRSWADAADNRADSKVRLDASEIPAGVPRLTVLVNGIPCGVQGAWSTSANTWRYHFEYNDKGHGPWLDETVTVGLDKIPLSIRLTGHDYFEHRVAEEYSRIGRSVTWHNGTSQGSRSSTSSMFYLTEPNVPGQLSAVPEELAMLAQALIASSRDRIALLPHGEARMDRAGHVRVSIPGNEETLEAVRISTLRSEAAELWLSRDGTLFAASEGPLMLIRRGWESALSQLRSRKATAGP